MKIIIGKRQDVRVSYTDRINSYMSFHCGLSEKTDGLKNGEDTFLYDFKIKREENNSFSLFSRYDVACTEMSPFCFSLVYPEFTLNVSLLLTGRIFPVMRFFLETKEPQNFQKTSYSLILLLTRDGIETQEVPLGQKPVYADFSTFLTEKKITFDTGKNYDELYKNHCGQIKAFLESVQYSVNGKNNFLGSEVNKYSESLKWAAFSGWSLVTGIDSRGIWAGLPWFRDNWGRDTFIAISGILLVTGHFSEARRIISDFASHQEREIDSINYGRIPNRYRGKDDVIFNTADGTLWFIRATWEYFQYTGDIAFLKEMFPVIKLAIEADRTLRTDEHCFLLHGDADTWMDARLENREPFSPRGSRADDVQALWYTALNIGYEAAVLLDKSCRTNSEKKAAVQAADCASEFIEYAHIWKECAKKLFESFNNLFLSKENDEICDCIHPDGTKDKHFRPNALFCITVPSVLPEEKQLLNAETAASVTKEICRRIFFPYGVCSLEQTDSFFHPYHDGCSFYHKDAAYHNGTIWLWNTGIAVQSLCVCNMQNEAWQLTKSLIQQILAIQKKQDYNKMDCCDKNTAFSQQFSELTAGTLSENLDAYRSKTKVIKTSGAWSQAWSVSEFVRNAWQEYLGCHPHLSDNMIMLEPKFPENWDSGFSDVHFADEKLRINWSISDEKSISNELSVSDEMSVSEVKNKIRFFKFECQRLPNESSFSVASSEKKIGRITLAVRLVFMPNSEASTKSFVLDSDGICVFNGGIPQQERRFDFAQPLNEKKGWGTACNQKPQSITKPEFLKKKLIESRKMFTK